MGVADCVAELIPRGELELAVGGAELLEDLGRDESRRRAGPRPVLLTKFPDGDTPPVAVGEGPRRCSVRFPGPCVNTFRCIRVGRDEEAGGRRAQKQGRARRSGDFFWLPEMEEAPMRDRSDLPDSSKKPERIAPEEIGKAVEKVVSESFGIRKEDVPPSVLKLLLGFRRTTRGASATVMEVVERMIGEGQLSEEGDHVYVANGA